MESFHQFYDFVKSTHEERFLRQTKSIDDNEPIEMVNIIKTEPVVDIKEDLNEPHDMVCISYQLKLEDDSASNSDSLNDEENREQSRHKGPAATTTSAETITKQCKTDSHSSLLSKFFNMACDLCDAILLSYRDTNLHYREVHDLDKGYLICCSKKFFRLQHMLQHCEWHMNPDRFK